MIENIESVGKFTFFSHALAQNLPNQVTLNAVRCVHSEQTLLKIDSQYFDAYKSQMRHKLRIFSKIEWLVMKVDFSVNLHACIRTHKTIFDSFQKSDRYKKASREGEAIKKNIFTKGLASILIETHFGVHGWIDMYTKYKTFIRTHSSTHRQKMKIIQPFFIANRYCNFFPTEKNIPKIFASGCLQFFGENACSQSQMVRWSNGSSHN